MDRAFSKTAAIAAAAPILCTRFAVNHVVDRPNAPLLVAFGGASYVGNDPNGDGGDDVVANAPFAISLEREAAVMLITTLAQAMGGNVEIKQPAGSASAADVSKPRG